MMLVLDAHDNEGYDRATSYFAHAPRSTAYGNKGREMTPYHP